MHVFSKTDLLSLGIFVAKQIAMKKQLLFFCLLAPLSLFAQHWMPIVAGEIYHYRLPDSAFATHTIRVDSVKYIGGDSVFYLNRVLRWHEFPDDWFFPTDTFLVPFRHQGQFLGKTMTKTANGDLIFHTENFLFDTTFIIRPSAQIGESWQAVPGENITATVISVVQGEVLGEPDSLKTIQFDNGAEWVISQNHGLVQCPDFYNNDLPVNLSGLETKGLGDQLHRFEDFFDFNVGDVLEYHASYIGISGSEDSQIKLTIFEKTASADTFRYRAQRLMKSKLIGLNNGTWYKQDTISVQYSRTQYAKLGSYNGQIVPLGDLVYFTPGDYSSSSLFEQGIRFGRRFAPFGPSVFCSVLNVPYDPNDILFLIDDALTCGPGGIWGWSNYFEEFRPSLGRVEIFKAVIDNTYQEQLTGAIIQGDTIWGSISPDWIFTAVKNLNVEKNGLKIFPNPVVDFAWLEIPAAAEKPHLIQVFGADGRLLKTVEAVVQNEKARIGLSGLPDGFLLVVVHGENNIWRGKLHKIK